MATTPDSSLGFLLENLNELIQHKSELILGVKDNVEELRNDLHMLKVFITAYPQNQSNNLVLENLISQIKDVVVEAEDAIDTYVVNVYLRKRRNTFSMVVRAVVRAVDDATELRHVTKKIQKVTKYVQDICKETVPLGMESRLPLEIHRSSPRRVMSVKMDEDYDVGLQDSSLQLIDLLTGGHKQLEVIAIIGMLGLGKTTLARKVYNDPSIVHYFFVRAFVNVSLGYNRREVLLRILNSFDHVTEESKKKPDEEFAKLIHKNLYGKRYLIVLDDVWVKEAWDDLKYVFPDNSNGSKVVITSRNKSVALYANTLSELIYLRFLDLAESQELLRRKVFGRNSCPIEIEDYELHILQRCNGLPLAIIVIAGILVIDRENIKWWKEVSEGVTEFLAKEMSPIDNLIKMSFSHLPHYLKPCFLYMGVFQEDTDIPVWKLLRLWIAEGFIESHQHLSLEDVAQGYLMEIVNRNLVMVGSTSLDGRIKTCRIHDTLRDFCKREARKENIFHEIIQFSQSESTSWDTFRRVCVNASVLDHIKSKPSGSHVRSFLCLSKEEISLPAQYVSVIPRAFKLLRVLEIRSIILTRFPPGLFQLILLKYIAICCDFGVLPEKLVELWNLQTLIIETSSLILDIQAGIWKLTHLRHLHTNASARLLKPKDEPLRNQNLQTLSTISPESCTEEVFDRTPNLKKLGIRGKLAEAFDAEDKSSSFFILSRLEKLENLKLLNSDLSVKLQALPPPDTFPRNLKKLTLQNTSLDWVHMSTLGKLEKLEVLKLKDNAFLGQRWESTEGDFPNLRVLYIGCTDLQVWEASADHFPKLERLFLHYCSALEALPIDFVEIPTLQEIDLYYTSSELVTSAMEIQRELQDMGSDCKLSVYPPHSSTAGLSLED